MAILKPDFIETCNGVIVKKFLLTDHNPNGIGMPSRRIGNPIAITIHNTDRLASLSSGATEQAEQYTRATYNGNMKTVRVHFYVDENGAWQNLPLDYQGWHAADGNGDGNCKTIAIECIMNSESSSANRKAEDNASRLCAYLLNKYALDISCLRTHTYWLHNCKKNGYGVTGSVDYMNTAKHPYKTCPAYIIPHWSSFKAKTVGYMSKKTTSSNSVSTSSSATTQQTTTTTITSFESYKVKIICDELNVRKTPAMTSGDVVAVVKKNGVYTIVGEKTVSGIKFGKLKSGLGYISLGEKYVKKV